MTTLLILLGALVVLMAVLYLAACAGADRWLPLREWLARTSCSHTHGRLVTIEWDGEAVYECSRCGRTLRRGLEQRAHRPSNPSTTNKFTPRRRPPPPSTERHL